MQVNLPRLILELRADLRHRFGFDRPERSDDYLSWLLTSGLREYHAFHDDSASLQDLVSRYSQTTFQGLTNFQAAIYRARHDVQKVFQLPEMRQQFLQWFWCHGVGEIGLWPVLTPAEKKTALRMALERRSPWLKQLTALARADRAVLETLTSVPLAALPFGVNLIGYAFGQMGIGEDLRMTAHALRAANVPFAVVNFEPGADVPQGDRTLARHLVNTGPYAINLYCMTALETGRFYAERGRRQFRGRYNIGYWPWELSNWPADWKLVFDLVDEVWVSTTHIKGSLLSARGPRFTKPIRIMPLVVQIPPSFQKTRSMENLRSERKRHRLPVSEKLFCFSFDLNSSIHRKNPSAVVKAFQKAFPAESYFLGKVGLVVKVQAPKRVNSAWEELKKLANTDRRIHIIEGTLPRDQLLALYKSCDCFVSLHRAEGFGRNLAEALQLGLHVIATDYSGNTDFCRRPEFRDQVSLIPYRLIKVRKGQYPYAEGQVWANPSVAAAAKAMRDFVERPNSSYKVPRGGWPAFRASILGQQYRDRLEEIYQMYKRRNKEQ